MNITHNRIWPWLTEFGPPMWQTEAETEPLSALPEEHGSGPNSVNHGQILLVLLDKFSKNCTGFTSVEKNLLKTFF